MECYSRLVPCYSDMVISLFPADHTKYLAVLIGDSQVVIPYKKMLLEKTHGLRFDSGMLKAIAGLPPALSSLVP